MTKKDNKKAHNSDTLAGDELQALQSADADQHRDRITRFGLLKHRSKLQEQYLWTQVDFTAEGENEESNKALKAATKLKGCGQFLLFRNYYTIDQIKLEKFHVCGQHLLCPMCAGIRAARSMNRYLKRINELMRQNPRLKPVLITLTVKNGESLEERYNHLTRSFRTLLSRYRDYKKKGWGFNQFCKIDGGFIQPNTPTTKLQTNGIRIFIFLHCLLIGLIRKNWPKHGTKLHTILTLWTFAEFAKPKLRDTAKLLQRSVSMLSSSAIYRLKTHGTHFYL